MHLVRIAALFVVACGGPAKRPPPAPAPAPKLENGCACEGFDVPINVPTKPEVLARWERAANEIVALHEALAALFPADEKCTEAINDEVARVVATHAHALDESAALDAASCDHFARWRMRGGVTAAERTLADATRARCMVLSDDLRQRISQTLIIRACTVTQ
jgi:hypothetical protein